MYKKHFVTKIVLLVIVIAGYGISASAALAATALTEQPPTSLHEAAKAGKIAQLEAEVATLEARLHKERHEFSKMGENDYKVFQYKAGEVSVLEAVLTHDKLNALGNGLCVNGDVNRDGFADILISASLWKNSTGKVFLLYGGKDIDFSSPDIVFQGEYQKDHFGDQSSVFADINNDGYDDVIIGARGYNNFDGRVYIYYGGPDMDNVADIIFDGEKGKAGRFGLMVTAGDLDNDGYADVLVGAQHYDRGRGRVYLYWGGQLMDTTADVVLEGEGYPGGEHVIGYGWQRPTVQGWFGRRIDAGGDVNGDGYDDILVGARHAFDRNNNGSAYLYFGKTKQRMDGICDCVFRGEEANDQMGSSLELFDIDNDGYSDVIVGARGARNWRGEVYIWWGGKDFNGNRPADIVLEGESGSNMGGDDIACGDFNDDGYGDILVGAYNYPGNRIWHGCAYVFYGNSKYKMDTDCDYIFDPEEPTGFFGMRVSVGDVNNDSYLDALIGSPANDRTFLYFGPFATEDLQDKIKAQQKRVAEVEQELNQAQRQLEQEKQSLASEREKLEEKTVHDVAVTNVSTLKDCYQGESVPVTVSVSNKGSYRETFRMTLTDTKSGKEIASRKVTLSKLCVDGSEVVTDLAFDAEADEVDYLGARICWDPEETGVCNIGSFLNAGYINNDEYEDFVYSAPMYDNCRGRVYVFYGSEYFDSTADFILTGEQTNMKFGHSLCLGDMNNDSCDDIIAGASWYNSKQGRVHIYYTGSNLDNTVDIYLENPEGTASRFGRQVKVGDINNDNYDDLFVTAISYNSDRGRIYLYYGGASFDTVPDKVFEVENEAGDLFGKEMAIGDVDGDSFGDLIVGSRDFDDGRGRAYLFWGATGTRMDTTVDVIFTGEAKRDQLGGGVNISDIDGDGAGELLIGARYWNKGQGRVSIYWGGTRNIDLTNADVYLYGKTDPHMSHLGERGLVCGNFNGDNYLDVLTGGSGGGISQGRAFIFYGDAKTDMDNIPDHVFYGESVDGGYAGESIKVDLNNDGYDEAVIPDVLYSRAPKPERGRVYLYYSKSPSSKDVSFNWDTAKASLGKHTLRITIAPVAGEENMADNVLTATVHVKTP